MILMLKWKWIVLGRHNGQSKLENFPVEWKVCGKIWGIIILDVLASYIPHTDKHPQGGQTSLHIFVGAHVDQDQTLCPALVLAYIKYMLFLHVCENALILNC